MDSETESETESDSACTTSSESDSDLVVVNEKIRRSTSKNGGGEIIANSSSATKQLQHFSIASLMATSSSTTSQVKNGNSSSKADELVSDSLTKKNLVAAASFGSNNSMTRSSSSANAGGSNLLDDENDVLASVNCHLETTELWSKFHEHGTEMLITKTGVPMIPIIQCSFSSFQEALLGQKFAVILDVVPYDNKRYRYAYHRSSWLIAGKADPPPPKRQYLHPDSPFSIRDFQESRTFSFEKVKLTNNEADKSGQIILNSMHKYQPRIHLALVDDLWNSSNGTLDLCKVKHKTFTFELTSFTAVTAYESFEIKKLKIDSYPFAKGFRDNNPNDERPNFASVSTSYFNYGSIPLITETEIESSEELSNTMLDSMNPIDLDDEVINAEVDDILNNQVCYT